MASYSGLWNNEYGQNYSALSNTTGQSHTALARLFARRNYSRGALGAVLKSLVEGDVGEPAIDSHKRVAAERDLESNVQGGVRSIETHVNINRVTTADDVNKLVAALEQSSKPTYPVDRGGNGGGGKLGW